MSSLKESEGKRARAEERLRRQLDFTRAMTNSLGEGVYALDREGRVSFMNRTAEQLLGWTEAELLGKNMHETIHHRRPDGTPLAAEDCPLLSVIQSGIVYRDDDDIFIRKDGEAFPVSYISSPVTTDGAIVGAVLAFRDTTNSKRVEQELQQQSRLTRTITDNAASCLFMIDRDGHPTFMNPAAEQATGYTLDEIRDRPLHEAVHYKRPDGTPYPVSECPIDNASAKLTPVREQEEIFVRKDGSLFPVSYSVAPLEFEGQTIGAVLEFRDITNLKRAEDELREQKETVETVNRIGRMLAAEFDLHKIVQAVTDAATEMTGAHFGSFFYNVLNEEGASYMLYTLSGVPREAFAHFPMPRATDLFGPTFRGEGVLRIDDVKLDPRYGKNSPYYGMPEGHLPVTSYLAVPVISRSGEVLGGLFFGHPDAGVFSERDEQLVVGLAAQAAVAVENARLFEAAERERARAAGSEQQYRFLAEAIPQQVWTATPEGALDYVNQRVLDYSGRARADVLGWGWQDMLHPDDVEPCTKRWQHSLETGETYEIEFRLRRAADSAYRWHLGRALPLRDTQGKIVRWFGTNTDITERKEAEAELFRRSRQSALGAEVGVHLAGRDSLHYVLQRCAEALVKHLDAAFARIWTLSEAEQMLELQASAGLYTHLDGAHGRVPVGQFKIGRIAATREPHLTNSVIGDPQVGDQQWAEREGMQAFAGYPLIVGDKLLGVAAMFSRHPLASDTLETLASIANTIAQGIERHLVEERLVQLSREREQMLEEVSTPVVPVWEGVLIVPIIGSLDTERMQRAMDAALHEVRRTGASACIIDITGARLIDSHAVANLSNLVMALRLVGAEAIVTGVGPHAAQSLVGLGLDLKGMRTHRTLAQALSQIIGRKAHNSNGRGTNHQR